jgi:hypothetical protein
MDSTGETKGRQYLSTLGTVIASKNGPDTDQFFITFDKIGGKSYSRPVAAVQTPTPSADIEGQPLIGLHRFAEIHATLSALTGIPQNNPAVTITYQKVQQQLPTLANIDGFLAAQQMGITQLAVAYCNALVTDSAAPNALRDAYFAGFPFTSSAASAFDANGRSQIIEPLMKHLLAHEIVQSGGLPDAALATQANPALLRAELNQLITKMTACGSSCESKRTLTTVKATCSAALGSAVMLLQ